MSTTLEAIKTKPAPTIDSDPAETSSVINPYALAELIAGRSIPWDDLPDVPRVLEDLLQTPYEELFDPIHEGPLYTGLRLNERMEIEQVRSPLLELEITVDLNDLDDPAFAEQSEIRSLADLGPRFQVRDVGNIAVLRAEVDGPHRLRAGTGGTARSSSSCATPGAAPRPASARWTGPSGRRTSAGGGRSTSR